VRIVRNAFTRCLAQVWEKLQHAIVSRAHCASNIPLSQGFQPLFTHMTRTRKVLVTVAQGRRPVYPTHALC
jgi:hypothetical protein